MSKNKKKLSKRNSTLEADLGADFIADSTTEIENITKSVAKSAAKTEAKSAPKSSSEYASYIIINKDLKMSAGKIASQSAHAILDVHRFLLANNINIKRWTSNGEKIVVLKASKSEIDSILAAFGEKIPSENCFNVFPIYDAGRTEVEAGSLTVLASTPITSDKKPQIIQDLKLL